MSTQNTIWPCCGRPDFYGRRRMPGSSEKVAWEQPQKGGVTPIGVSPGLWVCAPTLGPGGRLDKCIYIYIQNSTRARFVPVKLNRADVITRLNLLDIKLLDSYRVWEYSKEFQLYQRSLFLTIKHLKHVHNLCMFYTWLLLCLLFEKV